VITTDEIEVDAAVDTPTRDKPTSAARTANPESRHLVTLPLLAPVDREPKTAGGSFHTGEARRKAN
jgi:hypothetical protein